MICWSCQKQAGAGPLCAACGALQPPDDAADLFAVLGLPARYAVDLAAARGRLQGSVAPGAPRSLRDRRSARAARVAGAHRSAESGLADDQGSGPARRVPAHARGHRHRRQAADARQRGEADHGGRRRRPRSCWRSSSSTTSWRRRSARATRSRSRSWPRRCAAGRARSMKTIAAGLDRACARSCRRRRASWWRCATTSASSTRRRRHAQRKLQPRGGGAG